MAEYFFELLTEEIPAWMLPPSALTAELTALLRSELGMGDDAVQRITVVATSRRIAFVLRDLPAGQEDREQEVKGPPKKTAFAADGSPSPALAGFLKKQNASVE